MNYSSFSVYLRIIQLSNHPPYLHTFYIIHDSTYILYLYVIAVKYTLHTYQYIKLYTRYACHVLIIKSQKPLRKMNRLIPWRNLCNFVICVHVKMKLFEWNDVKLHSNERLRQFWVVVLINSFSFKIYLSTIN